jgi:hypothetical protein
LDKDITRDLRVQIAHRAHFLDRHPFGYQLLLHGHDLGGIRLADDLAQLFLYKFRSGSRMQLLDDFLQERKFDAPGCQSIRSQLFS